PRDSGTRYLRLGGNLWMFLPRASKTVKISGHMLRQSMMGSDFSYEDQTERTKFWEIYDCRLQTDEVLESREVFVMDMTAKPGEEVTYFRRKVWIDKECFVVLRSEMYAKSGKLLKVMHILKSEKHGERYYATHMRMEDKIRGGSYTDVIMTRIELDVNIPDSVFSLQHLERRN
ncbi:MAG: outer membrane lipoprotein-sorting protein, partial [Candidatus Wallbacteria bacterium]|nr:outer membrane lipoprotein-sorting protein [Candidatus Wallbacteria bacterium]